MCRIFNMGLDAVISGVILIPFMWSLNHYFWHNSRRTLCFWILAVYLSGMFAVAGLPDIRYVRFHPNVNLVPFEYMFSDLINSVLNVALFVPLGLLLPLLWEKFASVGCTVISGFCISLLIETLQIFTYRASDINDLITNTFGTLIGWILARAILRCFPNIRPCANSGQVYAVGGLTFGVMFFLHPFLADWVWRYV